MITQERANELFSYNTNTGVVTRRITTGPRAIQGTIVGSKTKGYLAVSVARRIYPLHRIIWLMLYGEFPKQIDHINHNREDNRSKNLREVTHRQNGLNQKKGSNNVSGITGVCWHNRDKRWQATISVKRKTIHLGQFTNKYKAIAVRKAAEVMYNFHPNHGI